MQIVSAEEVGFSSQRLSRVDKMAQGYVDQGKLAGTITLLARGGKTFHQESYGFADLESGAPMQPDSLIRIYSMSKPITSVALMMLYEDGLFHLDDPVSKFIPEIGEMKVYAGGNGSGLRLEEQDTPVTIRHLLTHTAGLVYDNRDDSPVGELYRKAKLRPPDGTLKEMTEKLAGVPLRFQPGTKWQYSIATDVVGYLVEVLSGRPFDEFLSERIFQPLGMYDTGFYVPEEKLDRFTTVYGPSENGITPVDPRTQERFRRPHTFSSGGGGLVSTAEDYLRFANMLLGGGISNGVEILGRKTVELMTRNHLADHLLPYALSEGQASESSGCGFGLGFKVILDIAQHGTIGSEGNYSWGGAASTIFWVDPKEELVAIFMTQFMPSSHYPIRREFQVAAYQVMVS